MCSRAEVLIRGDDADERREAFTVASDVGPKGRKGTSLIERSFRSSGGDSRVADQQWLKGNARGASSIGA
jgi:hypothetical protein